MVTGQEVFDRAVVLLGYTNENGVVDKYRDADLEKKALPIVNQVYADIYFVENPDGNFNPITNLNIPLAISERSVNDIMPYGVAMFLAQEIGDATMQSIFSMTYNRKRSSCEKQIRTINDTMPTGEW